jgi:hypothetical protein
MSPLIARLSWNLDRKAEESSPGPVEYSAVVRRKARLRFVVRKPCARNPTAAITYHITAIIYYSMLYCGYFILSDHHVGTHSQATCGPAGSISAVVEGPPPARGLLVFLKSRSL